MNSMTSKESSTARSKESGFSLDYTCTLSLRKAKGSGQTHSSGTRRSRGRGEA